LTILSSFITPEGSKIIQIKHLKHKITQQYRPTSKDDKNTKTSYIKVQIITDEAKLHHTEGSQIVQIKHKIHNITYKKNYYRPIVAIEC